MRSLRPLLTTLLIAAVLVPAPLTAQSRNRASRAADIAGQDEPDVVYVRTDDEAMNAAMAEARRTLPEFLAVLEKPDPLITNIVFKFPLGGKEHIWVNNVARDGDFLTGRLANVPLQRGWTFGEEVRVPLGEISDWAYRGADGVMRGHRTTRVMMGQFPVAERRAIMKDFGW